MLAALVALNTALGLSSLVGSTLLARDDLPTNWNVLQTCVEDSPRVIKNENVYNLDDNTPANCVAYCNQRGFIYAGVEWTKECHCGRELNPVNVAIDSDCDMPCAGDPSQTCGGPARIQLFAMSTPNGFSTPLTPGWMVAHACAVDSVSLRVLCNAHVYSQDEHNTPESCTALCFENGYQYAGVEYGRECVCGTGIRADVQDAPTSECSLECPDGGDSSLTCGAGDRIQIYQAIGAKSACPGECATAPAAPPVTGKLPKSGQKYDIFNAAYALRFDVAYFDAAPGTSIIAQTHNVPDTDNQAWNIQQVSAAGQSGIYIIHAVSPQSYVNVWNGGVVGDHTPMPLNVTDMGNDFYTISIPYTSLALYSKAAPTQQILLADIDYSPPQLWQFTLRVY